MHVVVAGYEAVCPLHRFVRYHIRTTSSDTKHITTHRVPATKFSMDLFRLRRRPIQGRASSSVAGREQMIVFMLLYVAFRRVRPWKRLKASLNQRRAAIRQRRPRPARAHPHSLRRTSPGRLNRGARAARRDDSPLFENRRPFAPESLAWPRFGEALHARDSVGYPRAKARGSRNFGCLHP